MTSESKTKTLTIAVLLVAVLALGIGFAAFSNTLTISSSASVTPDADTFKVVFSSSGTSVVEGGVSASTNTTPNVAPDATIDNTTGDPTITGLKATFTAPGQEVQYKFYVANIGEYNAYLEKIDLENATGASIFKTCTAGSGTDATMVSNACNGIGVEVKIGGKTTDEAVGTMLSKGLYQEVVVTLKYESGSARADGPFSVAFGNIKLTYTSAKSGGGSGASATTTYEVGQTVKLNGSTIKLVGEIAEQENAFETINYTEWKVLKQTDTTVTLMSLNDYNPHKNVDTYPTLTGYDFIIDEFHSGMGYPWFGEVTSDMTSTFLGYTMAPPTLSDLENIIEVNGDSWTFKDPSYSEWFYSSTDEGINSWVALHVSIGEYDSLIMSGSLSTGSAPFIYKPVITVQKSDVIN